MTIEIGTVLLISPILAAAFAVESTVGFGGSILSVTLLSFVLPAEQAVAFVPVAAVVASITVLVTDARSIDFKHAFMTVLWSLPGLIGGTLLVGYVPELVIRLVIAVMSVAYGVAVAAGKGVLRLRLPRPVTYAVAGFAGGIASIAILYVPALLETIDDKSAARSTMALLWIGLALVRLPILLARGMLPSGLLVTGAIAVPFLVGGIIAGYALHRKLSGHDFRRAAGVLLVIVGLLVLLPPVLAG